MILGVILHDCAMQLSEDGFLTLLKEERPRNTAFGDAPWNQLWHEFISEAKRFDASKLKMLFDDTEPLSVPPLDPQTMTRRDRLLIGEFLRRHHPRLASEIALMGIPGPEGGSLSFEHMPAEIKKLAGIVARSHGLDLRVSVDYFNAKSGWGARRTSGVHVTYLMVLLRIADYLQIHSERAPRQILRIRSLKSPVSRGEWDAHAAIRDIHQETNDPEALWIEAAPKDVKTYLKIKYLLNDIQRELDDSWAVLGEVYGPKQELRDIGVTIRRVRSNLDNDEAFAKTVSYVPCRAAVEAVGPELLGLLVKPLYGAIPQIGIRELLQNAVDACRELGDYVEKNLDAGTVDHHEQEPDVVIALEAKEDGTKWLFVNDHGIGMTVDTVLNYFLKAGSSFRNSHAWHTQHEDKEGKVRVLRSGRFGIGVLAGFLLGDEINVSTRHINSKAEEGIAFTCSLSEDAIQLERLSRSVGTTIGVQLSDDIFKRLVEAERQPGSESEEQEDPRYQRDWPWDWFCLKNPSVVRILPGGELAEQEFEVPSPFSELSPEWRRIHHDGFEDIHWSYLAQAPDLVCNGIQIGDLDYNFGWTARMYGLGEFTQPKVSVFDSRGNLPLNLLRTRLVDERLPFSEELRSDLIRDFIAYTIVNTPETHPLLDGDEAQYQMCFSYPGFWRRDYYWCAAEGISLIAPWHLKQLNTSRLHFTLWPTLPRLQRLVGCTPSFNILPSWYSADEMTSRFTPGRFGDPVRWLDMGWAEPIGAKLVVQISDLKAARSKWGHPSTLSEESDTTDHLGYRLNDTWVYLELGACEPDEPVEEKLYSGDENHLVSVATIFFGQKDLSVQESHVIQAWRELISLPFIPYNPVERREQLSRAYTELASYIEPWEAIKEEMKEGKRKSLWRRES